MEISETIQSKALLRLVCLYVQELLQADFYDQCLFLRGVAIVGAYPIGRRRYKRNSSVFDPSFPSFPNANIPFYQLWPFPVPTPAPAPFEKFLPQPPNEYPKNPYLAHMNDWFEPSFGFGLSYLPGPDLMGGDIHFPTADLFQDKNVVSGTWARAAPNNYRFGTQGGPLFPWMSKKYPDAIRAIDYIGRAGNFRRATDPAFNLFKS
uniref:Uncharacterized protein n=1 Tax=Romanomermis culicivorax TaxID=13658 RepID=A0A915KN17_ROMCU